MLVSDEEAGGRMNGRECVVGVVKKRVPCESSCFDEIQQPTKWRAGDRALI